MSDLVSGRLFQTRPKFRALVGLYSFNFKRHIVEHRFDKDSGVFRASTGIGIAETDSRNRTYCIDMVEFSSIGEFNMDSVYLNDLSRPLWF